MKNTTLTTLLVILSSAAVASAQVRTKTSEATGISEELAGQLEEIAMCHHAIKAAYHDAASLDQNPYYRYILNSPQKGVTSNVYPIPERCKTLETAWILNYTNLSANAKALQDKVIHDAVSMTISDIATDAQFLTVVINKISLEGEKAVFWENRDKHVP